MPRNALPCSGRRLQRPRIATRHGQDCPQSARADLRGRGGSHSRSAHSDGPPDPGSGLSAQRTQTTKVCPPSRPTNARGCAGCGLGKQSTPAAAPGNSLPRLCGTGSAPWLHAYDGRSAGPRRSTAQIESLVGGAGWLIQLRGRFPVTAPTLNREPVPSLPKATEHSANKAELETSRSSVMSEAVETAPTAPH
jgi:hypothetical protein